MLSLQCHAGLTKRGGDVPRLIPAANAEQHACVVQSEQLVLHRVRRRVDYGRLLPGDAAPQHVVAVADEHLFERVLREVLFKRSEQRVDGGKFPEIEVAVEHLYAEFILERDDELNEGDRGQPEILERRVSVERGEKIGLVMQNPNQMLSKPMIYEEVALGLTVRGVPEEEIRERVYETLKICGLYQFRNWPVSALSFGQKKRVTIASILVMKPEILILDEPTAGQDYRHYTEIMEFLKTINETQGTTIIMITHDMHLMLEYTNRAIVVADGQLLTIDTPAKVLTDETITAPAYLKQTSLYEMAVKCGIEDPSQFVQRFINYERAVR